MKADLFSSACFLQTTPLDPLAQPLLQALSEDYEKRYGDFYCYESDIPEMDRYPAALFAPPDGNFLLLVHEGRAIAGGAFMRLDQHAAEIKRVWTDAAWRRHGLALRVLAELEAHACRQGYARVFLTTGCRQPEAVGLYTNAGYTPLFHPDAEWEALRRLPFEKSLRLAGTVPGPADSVRDIGLHRFTDQ